MSIDGIDTSIDQNEVTCLNSLTREYVAGLGTPGTATFGIYIDPSNPVHLRMLELKQAGTQLQWAIGWSEAQGVPPTATTDSDGECVFVTNPVRSWLLFEGFMNAFPFSFAQNSQVTSNIGVQISGDPVLIPAET